MTAPLTAPPSGLELEITGYGHPDVVRLVEQLQKEYVARYGGPDETPLDEEQFTAPGGRFVVAYESGVPLAMGGWRSHDPERSGHVPGERAAEIKRMYVVAAARRRGLARVVLAELERTAAAAGHDWLVLETGQEQPEAIALYRSAGYADIPEFGHYCGSELSVHLGKPLAD